MIASNLDAFAGHDLGHSGVYLSVMNDVEGIGSPIFDNSSDWGSAGTLQSITHFPRRDAFAAGPVLHEIMHRWGNYIISTGMGSHWGFSSANDNSEGLTLPICWTTATADTPRRRCSTWHALTHPSLQSD